MAENYLHSYYYIFSNFFVYSFHIKSEPLDPPPTVNLVHENNNSPIATPHIKAEPIEVGADAAPGGLVPPMTSPLGNSSSVAAAAAAAAEVMKKYCSTCDISFAFEDGFETMYIK